VIEMENRTPENLFGAFWNVTNPATGNTLGNDLDVVDPQSVPGMRPFGLDAPFDPDHSHSGGFVPDAQGLWNAPVGCGPAGCPAGASSLAYVPTPTPGPRASPATVANYISLIENWSYANHVLQSNEGPSFPSHQYAIAAQSGGLRDSSIAPNGIIENPAGASSKEDVDPEESAGAGGQGSCATAARRVKTTNMYVPYPGNENQFGQATPPPCNEYPTIFDLLGQNFGRAPQYDVWQYIAQNTKTIWSGPMGVKHLYDNYVSGNPPIAQQPFAVDPDAKNLVANLTNQNPNPARPFAAFTFVTPCGDSSDHPNFDGISKGP
jgi:hypothetical protein